MWALSYLGSKFALIIVVFLAVVALGAVAWFAKNWKVAVAAALVLAAGFAYMQIDKSAYQRRVAEEAAAQIEMVRSELKTAQGRLATLQKISDADAKRAFDDAKRIDELETMATATPRNDGAALDAATAKRIGAIK
jgi:predicted negative regulator of RcsB-dependent stress response